MRKSLKILGMTLMLLSCEKEQINVNRFQDDIIKNEKDTILVKTFDEDNKLFLDFYFGMTSDEVNATVGKLKSTKTISNKNGKYFYTLNVGENQYFGEIYFNVNNQKYFNQLFNISLTFSNFQIDDIMEKRIKGFKLSDEDISHAVNKSSIIYDDIYNLYKKKYGTPKIATDAGNLSRKNSMQIMYQLNKDEFGINYYISTKKLNVYYFEDKNKIISFSSGAFGVPVVSYELKTTMEDRRKSQEILENQKEILNVKSANEI